MLQHEVHEQINLAHKISMLPIYFTSLQDNKAHRSIIMVPWQRDKAPNLSCPTHPVQITSPSLPATKHPLQVNSNGTTSVSENHQFYSKPAYLNENSRRSKTYKKPSTSSQEQGLKSFHGLLTKEKPI